MKSENVQQSTRGNPVPYDLMSCPWYEWDTWIIWYNIITPATEFRNQCPLCKDCENRYAGKPYMEANICWCTIAIREIHRSKKLQMVRYTNYYCLEMSSAVRVKSLMLFLVTCPLHWLTEHNYSSQLVDYSAAMRR